jgi:hypothetical protein
MRSTQPPSLTASAMASAAVVSESGNPIHPGRASPIRRSRLPPSRRTRTARRSSDPQSHPIQHASDTWSLSHGAPSSPPPCLASPALYWFTFTSSAKTLSNLESAVKRIRSFAVDENIGAARKVGGCRMQQRGRGNQEQRDGSPADGLELLRCRVSSRRFVTIMERHIRALPWELEAISRLSANRP